VLTGDKLISKDERPWIRVDRGAKGGRIREVPVIGSPEEVARVVEMMQAAGSNKVFTRVPGNADIHGYRAQYATRLYRLYARDITEIPRDYQHKGTGYMMQSEVYICRKDRAGVRYDIEAMRIVSQALGHNRISVIAGHYLDTTTEEV
jgi:hypothetical protein